MRMDPLDNTPLDSMRGCSAHHGCKRTLHPHPSAWNCRPSGFEERRVPYQSWDQGRGGGIAHLGGGSPVHSHPLPCKSAPMRTVHYDEGFGMRALSGHSNVHREGGSTVQSHPLSCESAPSWRESLPNVRRETERTANPYPLGGERARTELERTRRPYHPQEWNLSTSADHPYQAHWRPTPSQGNEICRILHQREAEADGSIGLGPKGSPRSRTTPAASTK